MGWLGADTGDRVVNTAPRTGDLRARDVHVALLGVVHHHHARLDPLADHCPRGNRAVGVVDLDPVVVLNIDLSRVSLGEPHHRAASVKRQHQQVVRVSGVDAPLLVRREKVQRLALEAVVGGKLEAFGRLGIDGRTIDQQAFTESAHPGMILIELLTATHGAPGNQLVNVGVTGVIGDMLILEAGPGRAGDNLARLGDDIAKADFFVMFGPCQVGMVTPGNFGECIPRFYCHGTIGFWCQGQNHLGGIDSAVNQWTSFMWAIQFAVVKLT